MGIRTERRNFETKLRCQKEKKRRSQPKVPGREEKQAIEQVQSVAGNRTRIGSGSDTP